MQPHDDIVDRRRRVQCGERCTFTDAQSPWRPSLDRIPRGHDCTRMWSTASSPERLMTFHLFESVRRCRCTLTSRSTILWSAESRRERGTGGRRVFGAAHLLTTDS